MRLDRCLEIAITVIMIALAIGIIYAAFMPFMMFAKTCHELETAKANGYSILPMYDKDSQLHKDLADNMIANLQTLAKETK